MPATLSSLSSTACKQRRMQAAVYAKAEPNKTSGRSRRVGLTAHIYARSPQLQHLVPRRSGMSTREALHALIFKTVDS
eukprot:365743-Chlamydomonas_euryale.AAC.12